MFIICLPVYVSAAVTNLYDFLYTDYFKIFFLMCIQDDCTYPVLLPVIKHLK